MKWSEAVRIVDQKALAVGLKDEEGIPMEAEEALAVMICGPCWDELKLELMAGKVTPESFLSWGTAYIEQFRRERVRRRTERYLNSIPHKIPHHGEVNS
jgi:hypothetical protein